jgi:hypothetical protein
VLRHHMVRMRKLGSWLGIAALALQLGWPLLAGALPRAVTLVPLCTVDGVTHYLEVPTGKDPLQHSAGHGDHCPLCFTGHASAVLPHFELPALQDRHACERIAPARSTHCQAVFLNPNARAPPLS